MSEFNKRLGNRTGGAVMLSANLKLPDKRNDRGLVRQEVCSEPSDGGNRPFDKLRRPGPIPGGFDRIVSF